MKLLHGYFLHTKTPSLPHRLNTPKGKKIFLKPPRKNLPYSKISLVAISIALFRFFLYNSTSTQNPILIDNNNHDDDTILPPFQWPISIHNEEFESISHPAQKDIIMNVPKFWSPPFMLDGPLMSRNLATRFGSYVDGNIDSDYRKKGNPNDRTIFVMIASYRDWQCR